MVNVWHRSSITALVLLCGLQLVGFAAPKTGGGTVMNSPVEQWEPPASIKKLAASLIPESFSPDGNRFATKSRGERVRVWDFRSGRLLYSLKQNEGAVVFSHDGRLLANGAEIRDAATGRLRQKLPEPTREGYYWGQAAQVAAFSPDDSQLCSGYRLTYPDSTESYDTAEFRVWSIRTGRTRREIGSSGPPFSISPNFRQVASGGGGFTDRGPGGLTTDITSLQTGKDVRTMPRSPSASNALAFSPDSRRFAYLRADEIESEKYRHLLRVVDIATGAVLWKAQPFPEEAGWALAFTPDGAELAAAGPTYKNRDTCTVKFWDTASGRLNREFRPDGHRVERLMFHPSRQILVTYSWRSGVKFWNLGPR